MTTQAVTMSDATRPPHVLPHGFAYNTPGTYNPPLHSHYSEVRVPDDLLPHMGSVIGKAGFYFKAITQAARVYYIWFNPARQAVEVWGPERRLGNAIGRILRRFDAARVKLQQLQSNAALDAVTQAVEDMMV